jgi:hypothetical protein
VVSATEMEMEIGLEVVVNINFDLQPQAIEW